MTRREVPTASEQRNRGQFTLAIIGITRTQYTRSYQLCYVGLLLPTQVVCLDIEVMLVTVNQTTYPIGIPLSSLITAKLKKGNMGDTIKI